MPGNRPADALPWERVTTGVWLGNVPLQLCIQSQRARFSEESLSPEANPTPVPIRYRPGDTIPALAVYRVIHAPHRADHFAVLRCGDAFPRCHSCGDQVRFEITDIRTFIENDSLFHTTQVNEIPHPDTAKIQEQDDEDEDGDVSAAG